MSDEQEIKFHTWTFFRDTVTNGKVRIPLDQVAQYRHEIEENSNKTLLIIIGVLCLLGTIPAFFASPFFTPFTVIAGIIFIVIALLKDAYFIIYSTSGHSIRYESVESGKEEIKKEIINFNNFMSELLTRRNAYLNRIATGKA